jgi:hypothetical protein
VLCTDHNFSARKGHVAPVQFKQFPLPATGLQRGNDEGLEVWSCGLEQLFLLAGFQAPVAPRFFPAPDHV